MSGIAGIYYLDGRPVERTDVERMVDRIAHRGPDGSGVWTDGPIGFGHRMLWTTPESLHEKLPLTNKTGELTITADARIDNRDELFSTLNLNGRPHDTITDSELILAAYEKWGEQCPEKLLGDFSFAIWDKRNQKIYCARDHMGVKPFYYYHSDRTFVFASEIKALLTLQEIPRRLNELKVADYLEFMEEDKAITFYQDILRLPSAHNLEVDYKGVRSIQYWSLDPKQEIKLRSDEDYAESFREIFMEAVCRRLRSAFPVGSMLSGGLDSSSIVCMARQLLSQNGGGRLHTFSAIFNDVPECDERPYINAVLAQDGLEPHYLNADHISPWVDLDHVFFHEDEPFPAPNLFIDWTICQVAKEHGVRVLLNGLDGDTTVSHGIAYLTELASEGRLGTVFGEINGLSEHFKQTRWKFLRSYCIGPLVPKPMKQVWRILHGRNHLGWKLNEIINPDFAKRVGIRNRVRTLREKTAQSVRTEREDHYRRLTYGGIAVTLEIGDKAAAAYPLEFRYPFFDRRLIEFCLALPPIQKIDQGWTRLIMRRAMTDILPKEIQWRGGKSDLSPNFNRALLIFERERLEKMIWGGVKVIENYIDISALQTTYKRFVSKGSHDDAVFVWNAVNLALWIHGTGIVS